MPRLRSPRNHRARRPAAGPRRRVGARRAAASRSAAGELALVWTVVGSLALGACVQPDAPGLAVKALPANLVFGADTDAPQAAAPANSVVEVPAALPALPPPPELSIAPPPFQLPPLPARKECPEAGINTFPEEVAARNVAEDRRPGVGAYRWQREGTQQGTHTASFEIPVGGFEPRSFQNVQPLAGAEETDFTFEQHQRDLISNETVITTFQVRTAGASISQDTLGIQPVPDAPEVPSTGEPDRGITIVGIQRIDKDGNERSWQAAPGTGVLLLPLPVRVNEEWQSQAADPTTFDTITYDGKVNPVERVDACGEVVEGWLVTGEMNMNFGGRTSLRETYDLVFVPQMGGIPVYEHIVETITGSEFTATVDVEYTIGQLEPDPLEEESA